MPKCPDCKSLMIFDYKIRRYVCQGCGVALTKTEIEDQWDEIHNSEDPEEKRKKEREEYRDWYFKKKK